MTGKYGVDEAFEANMRNSGWPESKREFEKYELLALWRAACAYQQTVDVKEGILEGLRMAAKAKCSDCRRGLTPDHNPKAEAQLFRWQHGVWPCTSGEIHDLIAEREKEQ